MKNYNNKSSGRESTTKAGRGVRGASGRVRFAGSAASAKWQRCIVGKYKKLLKINKNNQICSS